MGRVTPPTFGAYRAHGSKFPCSVTFGPVNLLQKHRQLVISTAEESNMFSKGQKKMSFNHIELLNVSSIYTFY